MLTTKQHNIPYYNIPLTIMLNKRLVEENKEVKFQEMILPPR